MMGALMPNKLTAYGFEPYGDRYVYAQAIMDGAFRFVVYADEEKILSCTVIDTDTDEEYVPFRLVDSTGPYVSRMRAHCDRLLEDIKAKCFPERVYRQKQSEQVIEYIKGKYKASPEFLWEDENSIFRNGRSGKWFAAMLSAKSSVVGLESEGVVEIIDLKAAPERVAELLKTEGILPGYHMNKKHWYTVPLNGAIETEIIFRLIDESHQCVASKR